MKFSIALRESAQLALQSLLQHKLRSLLSVLGISIGIFAIVFVFTLVDSLEMDIKKSVQSLGKKVIYIDKFEWMGGKGGEYPWWKYISRPNATFNEMDNLNKSSISPLIDAISFTSSRNVSLKNGKYSVESVSVKGFTSEFTSIQDLEIEQGRFFNKLEDINAKPVAVIGYNIAQGLFPETQQLIGKYITLFGKKVQVIGVFKNQGDNIINMDFDDQIVVPIKFMQIVNPMPYSDANIIVKAKENIDIDKFEKELEGSFRSIRRLNPKEENNFALNKISFLTDSITQFFSTIKILGIIIGMFSLLVGGFGVANIMFVSVKERTSLIGIQKALGHLVILF